MLFSDTHQGNLLKAFQAFLFCILFFYRRPYLVLVSLLPASLRAYQMTQTLATPCWMEAAVVLIRVFLFFLIIANLSNSYPQVLRDKAFWERLSHDASKLMASTWPKLLIAQLIVFIFCLYGLMNLLILAVVDLSLSTVMRWFSTADNDPEAFANAYVFFLKNMSVIPLSMVYMLKMLGVGVNNTALMPPRELS